MSTGAASDGDDSGSFGGFQELEDAFKAHFDLAEQQLEEVLAGSTAEIADDDSDAAEADAAVGRPKAEWAWPLTRSGQEKFVKGLRLSAEQVALYRSIIAKVTDVCLQIADVDAGKVTTCGSMGKGTASPSSADVDLVVFIDWLDAADIPDELPGLLDELQSTIEIEYPSAKSTRCRGKFSVSYIIDGIEVSIWIGVPNVQSRDLLEVASPTRRQYLKASVLPSAAKLMKRQTDLFHNMVRVVRQWRDSFTWEPHCKPKSYLLEVLVLEAFRRNKLCNINTGKTSKHSYPRFAHKLLITFFELVASVGSAASSYDADNLPPLFVYFGGAYKKEDIPLQSRQPLFERDIVDSADEVLTTLHANAIVMDPVNPTANLWLELEDPTSFVTRSKAEVEMIQQRVVSEQQRLQEERKNQPPSKRSSRRRKNKANGEKAPATTSKAAEGGAAATADDADEGKQEQKQKQQKQKQKHKQQQQQQPESAE